MISCVDGRVAGVSYCVSNDKTFAENVTKIVGELQMEARGSPTMQSVTEAIAKSLDVEKQYVLVFLDTHRTRRLARFLQSVVSTPSVFNVEYEVVVPPSRTLADLLLATTSLHNETSPVARSFASALLNTGVSVSRLIVVQSPVPVRLTVVKDEVGTIVSLDSDVVTTSQAPMLLQSKEEISSNVDTIFTIGAAAGVLVMMVIGSSVCYCRSPRQSDGNNALNEVDLMEMAKSLSHGTVGDNVRTVLAMTAIKSSISIKKSQSEIPKVMEEQLVESTTTIHSEATGGAEVCEERSMKASIVDIDANDVHLEFTV